MILEGQNNRENVGIEVQEVFDSFDDIFKKYLRCYGVARQTKVETAFGTDICQKATCKEDNVKKKHLHTHAKRLGRESNSWPPSPHPRCLTRDIDIPYTRHLCTYPLMNET